MASLVMSGALGSVSFAETASKASPATTASSKTTEKKDDAKKKTEKKKADTKTATAAASGAAGEKKTSTSPQVVTAGSKTAVTKKTAAVAEKGKTGAIATNTTAPAKPVTVTNVSTGSYRGNTAEHTFHKSTCRFYNSKNNTATFKTREEAIKAGYRPCKICKP